MKKIAPFIYYTSIEWKTLHVYFQRRWMLSASSQLRLTALRDEIKVPLSEVTGVVSPAPVWFERPAGTGGIVSNLSLRISRAKPVAVRKGRTWDSGWHHWDGAGLSPSMLQTLSDHRGGSRVTWK